MTTTTAAFPDVRTEIAGVKVTEIARRFGTPTFVYDAALIEARINDLRAFDTIRYAQKANSNLAVLDLVKRHGVLVDAVSAGEVGRAMAAGYTPGGDPPPIVYTSDIFDRESLDLVVDQGLHVNCGSPDMIAQLGERRPRREITLRINPGFGHGHSQKTNTGGEQSKHGIWHEQVGECCRLAARHDLTIAGLHMHIGSGTDLEHLSQVCGALERVALTIGNSITTIGTMAEVYRRPIARPISRSTSPPISNSGTRPAAGSRMPLDTRSGSRSSQVATWSPKADTSSPRFERSSAWVPICFIYSTRVQQSARPILYGAYHPMSIARVDGATDSERRRSSSAVRSVKSGDIFTQSDGGVVGSRPLPKARVGDYLVIERAGAYGFAMGSNYNSKPLAAEVMIAADGSTHVSAAGRSLKT